jgi:hypothetical protein
MNTTLIATIAYFKIVPGREQAWQLPVPQFISVRYAWHIPCAIASSIRDEVPQCESPDK